MGRSRLGGNIVVEIMPNEDRTQAKILVIGVGGAGNNAVNRMIDENIQGVELVGINTDKQALSSCKAATKFRLGKNWPRDSVQGKSLRSDSRRLKKTVKKLPN